MLHPPTEDQEVGLGVGAKPARVRRNLFGPAGHRQMQQDIQHLLRANIEAAEHRWNYDFSEEAPGEGKLQWQGMQWQEVPAFYRSRLLHSSSLQPLNVNRGSEQPASPRHKPAAQASPGQRGRRQTRITDYYPIKRCSPPVRSSWGKEPSGTEDVAASEQLNITRKFLKIL
ncbi:cyclin-dependent kinase inhibitor 1-like [Amblyraja radiata]|uniref:cyclin-dependent kinase inhibitor 1-like n=1 Tax=Amblyraja radiata TaxID=386614 RepID=UPI001403506C|nr:cyclin-dependent kinase inhibitor 1-like [Amblyraja radiata]